MNCPKFTVSIARKIMQLSIVIGNILKKVIVKLLKWRRIAVVKAAAATGVVKAVMGKGRGEIGMRTYKWHQELCICSQYVGMCTIPLKC